MVVIVLVRSITMDTRVCERSVNST